MTLKENNAAYKSCDVMMQHRSDHVVSADAGANGFWTSPGGAVGGNSSAGFRCVRPRGGDGGVWTVAVRLAMGFYFWGGEGLGSAGG
jgi:hypothetical protein